MYQQRPTGVTIVAVLFFIGGALGVLSGLLVLATPIPIVDPLTSMVASYQIGIGIGALVVGGLGIATGWGLWTVQDWGRIMAIVLLALSAVSNMVSGISLLIGVNVGGYPLSYPGAGVASLFLAGVGGWLIWYLLKPDVAAAFIGPALAPLPPTMPAPPPPTVPQPPPMPAPSMRPPRQPTVPIGVQPAPEGWLVLRGGPRTGQQFGLKRGRNTVGRDPSRADIVLDDETISGEHARIQFEQGQFYAYDLASTNGTYINNRRIQRQLLMDGDMVRFGNVQLVFKRVA